MSPIIGPLPNGTRGFDANRRITREMAVAFRAQDYEFAMRYVRRVERHDFDITSAEVLTLLEARLGLGVVQHVANDGWLPRPAIGASYGAVAAEEARRAGVPSGVGMWCDLEGVSGDAEAGDVIAFCNNWHAAVGDAGYDPGLYVGFNAGLTDEQLYNNLAFDRYWSAYNLDHDKYPAIRGVCLRQRAAGPLDRVPGFPIDFDVDIVQTDALGGRASFLLPGV